MYNATLKTPNEAYSLVLSPANGYYISTIDGLTGVTAQQEESQNVNGIGTTITNGSIASKTITITGYILDGNTVAKQALLSFCRPNMELLLSLPVLTGGTRLEDRRAKVWVKDSPVITQEKHSAFMVSFLMPIPFWSSAQATTINLSATDSQQITVIGEAAPEYKWEFTITAEVDRARLLIASTGEQMHINFARLSSLNNTAQANDKVRVYRTDGRLQARLDRGNNTDIDIIGAVMPNSGLAYLPVGSYRISLSTNTQTAVYMSNAKLTYYPLYAGVLVDGV